MGIPQLNLYGVALDAFESEESLSRKRRWAELGNEAEDLPLFSDPYTGFKNFLPTSFWEWINDKGSMEIDSHLTPIPQKRDVQYLTPEKMREFGNSGGCAETANQVEQKVLEWDSGIPFVIGVDHSVTGGVLRAISKKYGKRNITVIVLDSHFDGIPEPIRYDAYQAIRESKVQNKFQLGQYSFTESLPVNNSYIAGSFLSFLICERTVAPDRLKLIGLSEYAGRNWKERLRTMGLNPDRNGFEKTFKIFRRLEGKGTEFITKSQIQRQGVKKALGSLKRIRTPYLYVSVDMDIIANSVIQGARFLNVTGITEQSFYQIAEQIHDVLCSGVQLAGLDIMEIDVARAGKTYPSGESDRTFETAVEFINRLIGWNQDNWEK